MNNRETHKKLCEKYTELKKENKILIEKIITLEEEAHTLNTLLKLWKGTAP